MSQSEFAVFDEYGVDPLKNRFYEIMDNVPVLTTHVVKQDDIGNVDRLSLDFYKTQSYGFAILAYNGIMHEDDLEIGSLLQIPDISNVKNFVKREMKRQPSEVAI
tara:strand:- start:8615 stop:8929 length:315 start_codon:yes stop_codon:yes gene_type:complete